MTMATRTPKQRAWQTYTHTLRCRQGQLPADGPRDTVADGGPEATAELTQQRCPIEGRFASGDVVSLGEDMPNRRWVGDAGTPTASLVQTPAPGGGFVSSTSMSAMIASWRRGRSLHHSGRYGRQSSEATQRCRSSAPPALHHTAG
jgi:hypothetical protein